MLELDLSQLFSLILITSMSVAAGIIVAARIREGRLQRELERRALNCRACGRSYLHDRGKEGGLQECPYCGSPNVTGPDRRLG